MASTSKADARDLDSGQPTPEAPCPILDVLGTIRKLPSRLQARGEFEYVGTKALGTGCLPDPDQQYTGTPVKEFRGALVRPFKDRRLNLGVNFLVASGYTGQTIENFSTSDISEAVGGKDTVASVTFTYRLGAGKTS